MPTTLPLLLPMVSSIVFVFGALFLKRAADLGADVWPTTRTINYVSAVVAIPLWFLGGTVPEVAFWWQPPLAALLFFAGQVCTLLALSTGDVSVATPVLGVKVLLVAILTTVLIGDAIGVRLWTAPALSTTAVALLNAGPSHPHKRVGATILLASLGATAYALFDVLVQKWSAVWGARFLPVVMMCAAVYSIGLRMFDSPLRPGDRSAAPRRWVAAGALCFAVQGLTFIASIAIYRHAPVANVLYSSRGLWSVLAVWGIGHWFANREQHLGPRVLGSRLVGAVLLMAALVMVLLDYRSL